MHSCWACIGRVWLCTTLWTLAQQAPQCIGFSRQEYVLDCHFLLQAIFQTQGATMTPASPAFQADSLLPNQVATRWTIREVQLGNHKICVIKTYYRTLRLTIGKVWNWVRPCGAPRHRCVSVSCFSPGRLQPLWPSLSSKGRFTELLIKGEAAKISPEARLRGSGRVSHHDCAVLSCSGYSFQPCRL